MLKRNWKRLLKSRRMVWVLLLCLIAGAVAGNVYRNNRPEKDIEQLAEGFGKTGDTAEKILNSGKTDQDEKVQSNGDVKTDEDVKTEEKAKTDARAQSDQLIDNSASTENGESEEQSPSAGNDKSEEQADSADRDQNEKSGKNAQAAATGVLSGDGLDFLKNSALVWPVEGEVLLEFNMDETVYFPTLNMYKCSQAVVIQAERGTPVIAPAEGTVVSIGKDEQIGNYMVLDIGDGCQVKLGQLKDMEVKEGDPVKESDLLAYVADPSECYSVEGDNLYLALTADGEPVDPLDYLQY
ncbi:MAG: M23 family metallopeptidase [Lachnospiraceae bacterium]|nr:M23 family metallopeptidase [Lachnospiraceae bacterium]